MSEIYGLIHLDGSPVMAETIDALRTAALTQYTDSSRSWLDSCAGLGSILRFDTPKTVNEQVPLQSPLGFVLTAEARLGNRAELCDMLGIPAAERAELPDGKLVLRAYETWGEAAPDRLLGDWSFAAWHPAERKLFLARDHFGNTALYYFRDEKRFAFASSRTALYALGIPRRLNEFYLAVVLVSWSAHHGEQTIELDLHRLPPAHTLSLRGKDASPQQYWRLEDTPELKLSSSHDYVEGFLEVYDRAVCDRLRSPSLVGTTLSGGLDSGSVTVLAARALRHKNKHLRAYTSRFSMPAAQWALKVSQTNCPLPA